MEPRAKPATPPVTPTRQEQGALPDRPNPFRPSTLNADARPAKREPGREEGWLDLSGGQIEFGGRKFVIVEGRLTHFNPNTNEALGTMSIISPIRPSLMSGAVVLRIHRLEFMLSMLQAQASLLPGEHKMSFAAVLVRA